MRLEQLEYLIEISKSHSITLAGQKLHITQQSISKAIKNLEDELGAHLLQRSSQGVSLTAEGRLVLNRAQKIFAEINAIDSDLRAVAKSESDLSGRLRIMYNHGFNHGNIIAALRSFSADNPQVQVDIHQKSLSNLLNEVWQNHIDLGLTAVAGDFHLGHAIEGDKLKSLSLQFLAEDFLTAAVSKSSPLAKQKTISMSTIIKNRVIFLQHESDDDMACNWLSHVLTAYAAPPPALSTSTAELYIKSIAEGLGVGFFSQTAKQWLPTYLLENIEIIPIRPAIPIYNNIVTSAVKPLSAVAAAFLPYLAAFY